ncbi:putative membrane protein [Clostridium bornimense]|uniref:Putative membrane protein n=1 Tax=Clostridium bornimense TaxID=1216932 RepID=W6RST3_9CLOT|nr:hypothetical protein [Clostridium bornimense]CDM67303.1 putative membrane protein [Clostridium bornimense]
MIKSKRLMVVVFAVLTILSICDYVEINEKSIFGLAIGALIISISTCFELPEDVEKMRYEQCKNTKFGKVLANKNRVIQEVLYYVGFIVMFIILFVKPDTVIDAAIKNFNIATIILLAITINFLSMCIADINTRRIRRYYTGEKAQEDKRKAKEKEARLKEKEEKKNKKIEERERKQEEKRRKKIDKINQKPLDGE